MYRGLREGENMYQSEENWRKVDEYFIDQLVKEDGILLEVKKSAAMNNVPTIEVAANQGKFLYVIAQMINAKRVLEFGTLAGYSAIWFARAIGSTGRVITLEINKEYAQITRENFKKAKVSEFVELLEGPALQSAQKLVESNVDPFDLIFIDADKPNNPKYLEYAIKLIRSGGVVIFDNVVRNGEICNPDSQDDRVFGVRKLIADMASNPQISATTLQTVGLKGWDGFTIAVVKK